MDELRDNQCDILVKALLQNPKGLSAREITLNYGMDARKRISDLRKKDYEIEDRWEDGVTRYGYPCRFKVYFFTSEFRERLMGYGRT